MRVPESLIVTIGDIRASGLSVGSEAYSNPWLIILTLLILFAVFDFGEILPSIPFVDVIPVNFGNFLYSIPPKDIVILSIPPVAVLDVVEYLSVLVFKFV